MQRLPYLLPNSHVVDVIARQDFEAALNFTAQEFTTFEPITTYLKTTKEEFINVRLQGLRTKHGPKYCIGIKDKASKFQACALNYPCSMQGESSHVQASRHMRMVLHEEALHQYRCYYHAQKLTGTVFTLGFGAVQAKRRGDKYHDHLLYASILQAKEHGFSRLEAEVTNSLSLIPMLKAGFNIVHKFKYADWVYEGPKGRETPLRGMNEWFTNIVNGLRPGQPPRQNCAEFLCVVDAAIDEVLAKCQDLSL
jgi:hypothetical protein